MTHGDATYIVMIDEFGNIFEISGYQKGRKIGVDIRQEEKLLQEIQEKTQDILDRDEIMENWHKILVENDLIKIPKTPEEIMLEQTNEQMRIMQEREERQREKDQQQFEINQALLKSTQDSSRIISQFEKSMQQSNDTILKLETTVKELMNREYVENNGKCNVERGSDNGDVGQSPKKPANPVKNNGKTTPASSGGTGKGKKDIA